MSITPDEYAIEMLADIEGESNLQKQLEMIVPHLPIHYSSSLCNFLTEEGFEVDVNEKGEVVATYDLNQALLRMYDYEIYTSLRESRIQYDFDD